jgi:hypothetical protein
VRIVDVLPGEGVAVDEFNFLFSLFGLLLGFAIAEVVGAFGRLLRAEDRVHIPWLTALLGLSVLIDIASFWLSIWELRAAVRNNMATLLIGLAFCAGYYLIALQAAPPEGQKRLDLDLWYWRVKRKVIGGLLAINLAIFAVQWLVLDERLAPTPYAIANAVYLALLAAIIVVRGKRLNIALLAVNVALFAASAVYGALQR